MMVNTLSSIGAVGATTALPPSLTLGCGSFGGNITSDNVSAKHLINIKRMAYGIKEVAIPKPSNTYVPSHKSKSQEESLEEIVDQVIKQLGPNRTPDARAIAQMVDEVIKQYN